MKSFIAVVVMLMFLLIACGDSKTLCFDKHNSASCQEFETYGFIDRDDIKDARIHYDLVTGDIIWSIVFSGSLAVPILLLGFDMYEPVGIQSEIK
jgi:hypothetical protein